MLPPPGLLPRSLPGESPSARAHTLAGATLQPLSTVLARGVPSLPQCAYLGKGNDSSSFLVGLLRAVSDKSPCPLGNLAFCALTGLSSDPNQVSLGEAGREDPGHWEPRGFWVPS